MGFGTLLVGYLFLLNIGVYDGLTNLIGFSLMAYGMLSLRVYNKNLTAAFYAIFPLLLLGIAHFTVTALEMLSIITLSPDATTAFAVAVRLFTMAFTVFLLSGIRDLAEETGIPVLRGRAARNRILTYVYYFLAAALEVATYTVEATQFAYAAVIPVTVFGFLVILLNVQVLHNAFRWICMPEDLVFEDDEDTSDPGAASDPRKKG